MVDKKIKPTMIGHNNFFLDTIIEKKFKRQHRAAGGYTTNPVQGEQPLLPSETRKS
jgi:hypothetical protein